MDQHDEDMLNIAQNVMGSIEHKIALYRASLPRNIPEKDEPILKAISTFLTDLDIARGYSESRGEWPFGVEHNHYPMGSVFRNKEKSKTYNNLKTNCAYVVCVEWTGDCHHQFIPFDIDAKTGVVTPQAPIYDYEHYGRPLAIVHPDNLLSLQNGWPIATRRPDQQSRQDGQGPSFSSPKREPR